MKIRLLFLLGLFALASDAKAGLRLPAIIADHMVLQQDKANLWGWSRPGKTITASLADEKVSAISNPEGRWKMSFPNLKAGGPYDLVLSGDGSVTLTDVLVGDVWVASGQSNMELPLNNTRDSKTDVPQAKDPQLRWFVQDRAMSVKPLEEPKGSWKICSPDNAKDFSAAAYYFSRKLRTSLKIPLGVIGTYWGGTWIESWMPRKAFKSGPTLRPILREWDALSSSERMSRGGLQIADIRFWGLKLVPKDPSGKSRSILLGPSGDLGKEDALGGTWTSNAQSNSSVTFTSETSGGPKPGAVGRLKAQIQAGGWGNSNTPFAPDDRALDLSAYEGIEFYAKGSGRFNVIFFQPIVTDWDNYGSGPLTATGTWKKFHVPFKDLKQSGWGASKPFEPSALQALCLNPIVPPMTAIPSGLYNGMVQGLTPYGIKGVIWYQGETNAEKNAANYRHLLPAMIRGWREIWGQGNFPFIYAQLPIFREIQPDPSESAWAEIREGQRLTLSVPNTGMAVLLDLGEAGDIHPKDKKDVGERLALSALHTAYGRPGDHSGPLLDSAALLGNKVQVKFTEVGKGLMAKEGKPVTGFALAGPDGKFHWAEARILGNDSVEVSSQAVKEPRTLRYAWADDPRFNLYNKAGLPASPFECDLKPLEKP